MSAQPMGRPGWPEFAFWTASMERTRMVLTARSSKLEVGTVLTLAISSSLSCKFLLSLEARRSYGVKARLRNKNRRQSNEPPGPSELRVRKQESAEAGLSAQRFWISNPLRSLFQTLP